MTSRAWNTLIGLLWLALPLAAIRHWMMWDRLPARLATHFDFAGHPNGWMSRQESLVFILVLISFLLLIATVVLIRVPKPDAAAWATLGLFYVIVGVLVYVDNSIMEYNISGQAVAIPPILIPVSIALVVAIVITLTPKRGSGLPTAATIAEEVHASPLFAALLFLPAIGEFVAASVIHVRVAQVALSASGVVFLSVAAAAWSGFHYFFSEAGVEIRTLGFRLRSIPAGQIRQYAADRWSPLYGYGIRGLGSKRGYVWGNRGVRIHTIDGEVFLGHDRPERIVHDLDVIKQFAR